MKRLVKKTDALLFLKNKGIDEITNNVRTLGHTASLLEEYAVFKIKENARYLLCSEKKQLPALKRWENYIKQFPKLEEYWNMIPEPAKTLFTIQVSEYGSIWHAQIQKLEENNKLLIGGLAEEMVKRKGLEDRIKSMENGK